MKRKGVTMIEMVIVVLILILLAIIAIWSSKKPSLKAEALVLYKELEGVYDGITQISIDYNASNIDDYTEGEDYNEKYKDASGNEVEGWYVIYGLDMPELYNEEVIKNIGVSELKRSYKVNFNEREVEYLNGPVELGDYKINSYEEMETLIKSGVI